MAEVGAGMGKSDWIKTALEPEAPDEGPKLSWDDLLTYEVTDIDYISAPYLYADEADEGAPASVYADKGLLRQWLARHHPSALTDDAGAAINARNRAMSEACRKAREVDPRARELKPIYAKLLEEGRV